MSMYLRLAARCADVRELPRFVNPQHLIPANSGTPCPMCDTLGFTRLDDGPIPVREPFWRNTVERCPTCQGHGFTPPNNWLH